MAKKVTDSDFEDKVSRVMKRVESLVRETLSHDIRPLHEIELDVDKIGDIIKETITQEVIESAGLGYVGTRARCDCGGRAKFRGHYHRQIITLHGKLGFRRAYYHCRQCRAGFCPIDGLLELGIDDCSRVVKAHAARLASYLPFSIATEELEALRRVRLSVTTVQRHAKSVGVRIGSEWDRLGEQVRAGHAPPSGMYPRRLFASMDAAKCHIGGEWRDAKLIAAYHRADNGSISFAEYYASLERSTEFGLRIPVMAHVAGADHCTDHQMIGDGGEWIWNETSKHNPTSVQTLDFYHLTEHVQHLADARFGQRTATGREWVKRQKAHLLNDDHRLVVKDISEWRPSAPADKEIQRTTLNYMNEHKDRMNYKTLRDQGYDIGSGAIESACKNVIKARMGGAGMRWEKPGATAVLYLSAFWRSDRQLTYLQYA